MKQTGECVSFTVVTLMPKKKKKKWTGECTSVTQFGTVILMELNMKKKKKEG